jgi:tRNA 2-thiouridine synthesizing protein D
MKKKLTLLIMDPPYESPNSTTALRIVEAALRKGHSVNVFAYEGAVSLTFAEQKAHANPVKGTTADEEKHPLPKELVAGLFEMAQGETKLNWVNCGLCVDERGVANWIPGPVRGGPADFIKMVQESDATLVIPTK